MPAPTSVHFRTSAPKATNVLSYLSAKIIGICVENCTTQEQQKTKNLKV